MSRKSRGIAGERDLIHKFWSVGWASVRVAGSGSSQFPSPDIITSNNIRKLVIETKITREDKKYFPEKEIRSLKFFAEKFGAEPWIGLKFFQKQWLFISTEDLRETKSSYVISKEEAEVKGLTLEELTN